jgi:FkbM family methyltransferase
LFYFEKLIQMKLIRKIYSQLYVTYLKKLGKFSKGWRIHYSKKLNIYFLLNLDNYIDFLIYKEDCFEPYILNAIKNIISKRKVTTFIDVGSNIGQMSLFVASNYRDINVISFEAFKKNYIQQISSMLLNNLDYKLYNIAISDSEEDLTLYLPKKQDNYDLGKYNSGMPSINLDSFREEHSKFTVQATTLSKVLASQNDTLSEGYIFVKIDVEGAELNVIKGFHEFFSKNSGIIIIIEMLFERDKYLYDEVTNILLSEKFNMFDINMNPLSSVSELNENTDLIFIKEKP